MTDTMYGGFLRGSNQELVVVGKNGSSLVGSQFDPVRDHAAVGDATVAGTAGTDDTAAIQASINDAYTAGGGDVLIARRHRANNLILKDGVQLYFVPGGRLIAPSTQAAGDAVVRQSEPGSIPSSRDGSVNGWVYGDAMHAGLYRPFIDGNARNGAAGDGIRLISGNSDAAWSLGGYQYLGVSESWNGTAPYIIDGFIFDVGRHGLTMGRNTRGAYVANVHVFRARQRGFWFKGTDSDFKGLDAGACGDGFYLDQTFQSNRVANCKGWFNYTTAAAPSNGTAWSGTGHGWYMAPAPGASVSGNTFATCESQDNYGYGLKLDGRRSEVFKGFKCGGDQLGGVGLFAASNDCEYNDIEVHAQWADTPTTLLPQVVMLDGANTKNNNLRISDDPELAYSGTVTPIAAQNSAVLTDNRYWGPAFERWAAPTLVNSWADAVATSGTRTVAYRMNHGRVELRGSLRGGSLNTTAFTLPTWMRPNQPVVVPFVARDVSVASGADMDVFGLLNIASTGTVAPLRWESASAWVAATDATGDRMWIDVSFAL